MRILHGLAVGSDGGFMRSEQVMIFFNSQRFPTDSSSKVYSPEEALWERAGAIRLSARNTSL